MTAEAGAETLNAQGFPDYLTHQKGLKSWLLTVDHKRIGLMYLVMVSTF